MQIKIFDSIRLDAPFDEEACKRYSGWILSAIKNQKYNYGTAYNDCPVSFCCVDLFLCEASPSEHNIGFAETLCSFREQR